jgi:HEAT repeat protein
MRTLSLLGLLLLAESVAGQAVAPPPRELAMLRRPPAKAGEFGGKTLAQWEAEVRSGDGKRRRLAASAAYAWGREAAPLAKAFLETIPAAELDASGTISAVAFELDHAALFGALGPDSTPHLLAALNSRRPEVRLAAAEGLSGVRPVSPETAAALADALADPDRSVKLSVASALRKLGPGAEAARPELSRRALVLLAEVLRDPKTAWYPHMETRDMVEALLALDPPSGLAVALRAGELFAKNDYPIRDEVLFDLGPAAVPTLCWLVRRSTPDAYYQAYGRMVELCRRMGPHSAPVLVELLRKGCDLYRDSMIVAPRPTAEDVWRMKRSPAAGTLSYLARCVGHRLGVEHQMRHPRFRVEWVPAGGADEVLASFGPAAKAVAPELRRWLRGRDLGLHATAMYVLAAMGDEEARTAALAILKDKSQPPAMRCTAMIALGEFGDPAAIPVAVAALLDPPPKELTPGAVAAIRALGQVGPAAREKAVPVLRPLLTRKANYTPDDHPVQAAVALVKIDPTELGPYRLWVEQIDSYRYRRSYSWPELDREVRKNRAEAVKALDRLANELPWRDLWKILGARVRLGAMEEKHYARLDELAIIDGPHGREPHRELFAVLVDAGEAGVPALAHLMGHADPFVRRNAAQSLVWKGRAAEKTLVRRATDEPDPWTREWIVFALRSADPKVAIPALRKALKDEEVRVRFHAAVALADLDPTNPDVARTLLDIQIPADYVRSSSWGGGNPSYERPGLFGREPKELGVVRREALYKADPEAAVRARIACPFAQPWEW